MSEQIFFKGKYTVSLPGPLPAGTCFELVNKGDEPFTVIGPDGDRIEVSNSIRALSVRLADTDEYLWVLKKPND